MFSKLIRHKLIMPIALAALLLSVNVARAFDPFGLEKSSRVLSEGATQLGAVVVDASGKWVDEVEKIRKALDQLPSALKDNLSPVFERLVLQTGTGARATIQFTVDRLRQNARLLLALKKSFEGDKSIDFAAIASALAPPDPSLIGTEAGQIELEYANPLQYQAKRKALIFHGYDLRQGGGKWTVEILDKDQVVLREANSHLSISSPYEMAVNTSENGIKFTPNDHSLRIKWGKAILSTVPITWGEPLDALKNLKCDTYTVKSNGRKAYIYDCGSFYWFESEIGQAGAVEKASVKSSGEFVFNGMAAKFESSGVISWGASNVWIPAK